MLYEKAGDHYVGLILAGLSMLSSHFVVSEPNFWTLNPLDYDASANKLRLMSKYHLCYNHYLVISLQTSNSPSISTSWSSLCTRPQYCYQQYLS